MKKKDTPNAREIGDQILATFMDEEAIKIVRRTDAVAQKIVQLCDAEFDGDSVDMLHALHFATFIAISRTTRDIADMADYMEHLEGKGPIQ